MRDWQMTEKQQNIYNNLWEQVERAFDFRSPQQAYRGVARYRSGLSSFCKHLAIHYRSSNFRNIRDKHLESFIEESQKAGVSVSTLKADLSAIRKLHDRTDRTRYRLSDNQRLGFTEKRRTRGNNRAWTDNEVQRARDLAIEMGRHDVRYAIDVGRSLGLRIEEVTALRRSQVKEALEQGYVSLTQTKGGIARDVPLTDRANEVFRDMLSHHIRDYDTLFVHHGRTHAQAQKSIQNWLIRHRDKFSSGDEALTFHGLRYAYAREQYEKFCDSGLDEKQARQETAKLLGHGRDEVTQVYLV